jgi:hypothetical protein
MVWALLVAAGVAVVCMTLFAAKLTKRDPRTQDSVEFAPVVDPSDPWAAWQPRSSFDDLDKPRPRLWPLLGALTGIVLLGAGLAGARQTIWATAAQPKTALGPIAEVTTQPDIVQVQVTDAPTPAPTIEPTAAPTPDATDAPAPVHTYAPAPAVTKAPIAASSGGGAPTISASPSCSGSLAISYTVTSGGSSLSWFALYVDGSVAKGGPISGTTYSSSYSKPAAHGDHSLEISVQDKAGHTARKQFQVHCP